jgi:predicted dehydrogenase
MVRLAIIGTLDEVAHCARAVPRIVGAQLAAAVDRQPCAAESLIQEVGTIANDFEALLTNHSAAFDAVVVYGDLRDQLNDCRLAAEAGKHLLVEELLGLPAADVATIDASCAAAGVRLMAGRSLRFLPEVQAIQKSLAAGQLGEPGLLRMHFWEPVEIDGDGKPFQISRRLTADSKPDWLTAAMDLANLLFNQVPTQVYATIRTPPISAQGEHEYCQVHLGFCGGGMALIDHAKTLPPGEHYFAMSLIGSQGAAYADDHHNLQLLYRGGQPMALRPAPDELQALGMLQEFVSAIQENRDPLPNGADVIRAIRVSESIVESLATHQVVQLDDKCESAGQKRDQEATVI